jgi:hypothetical protein
MRICVVVEGRVKVVLHHGADEEMVIFEIGKGGLWRVKGGETCEVHAIDAGKGKQKEGTPIVLIHVFGVQ